MATSRKTTRKASDDDAGDMKLAPVKKKASVTKHITVAVQRPTMVEVSPSPTSMATFFPSSAPKVASVLLPATKSCAAPKESCSEVGKGLLALGIRPAHGDVIDRSSTLKCCIIREPTITACIFRFEPTDLERNASGSWAEKLFFDAVKDNMKWVMDYNVDHDCLHWYHENVLQLNPKRFPIRMFVIRMEGAPPAHNILMQIGKAICENVNAMYPNKAKPPAALDGSKLYWMTLPDGAVWADVIGYDAALTALFHKTGPRSDEYYALHESTIHSFFHRGTLSLDLARILHAPNDQIHPSELEGLKHDSMNESD